MLKVSDIFKTITKELLSLAQLWTSNHHEITTTWRVGQTEGATAVTKCISGKKIYKLNYNKFKLKMLYNVYK